MFSNQQTSFLRTKQQVVLALRLVILVSMAVMACWGQKLTAVPYPVYLALLVFLINTFLLFGGYFRFMKFVVDLAAMTALVYYSGGPEAQVFYLVFLVTILITATAHTLTAAFVTSFAVSIVYGLLRLDQYNTVTEALFSFSFLSKVAFLFIIATFIGYLAEDADRERQEKEEVKAELVNKERLALVGQLASGLAHDFFNILGGLKKLIEFSLQKDSPQEQREVMKYSTHGLDRAMTIVRNLLTYAKKPNPQFTLTKIDKIIDDALMLVKRDLEKDKIQVTTQIASTIQVKADPVQLQQVILNLLLNARQAMLPKGGQLNINVQSVAKHVEIIVTDTGCGISSETKAKIFEPFFSSKSTFKDGTSGIGLGLYVTKEIVKTHHGSIIIESQPNKGTKVIIRLPIT